LNKKIVRRLYRYTCDECGWEAVRGDIIPMSLCSKCGNTKPPKVSTEEKEFEISAEVEKAVEYTKKLIEGDLNDDVQPPEKFPAMFMVSGVVSHSKLFSWCVVTAGPYEFKTIKEQVVY
jgi:hypothetical protein